MITLYRPDEGDFSTNGVKILDSMCMSAIMHEELNGECSLELELTTDARLMPEMILKVPAPPRHTPLVEIDGEPGTATQIYRVNGGSVNMRTGPGTKYSVVKIYKRGTLMILLGRKGGWSRIQAPDGKTGYMLSSYLTYVRTDATPAVAQETVEPHKAQDQLFRVSNVTPTLESIQARALHIFYDLRRNYVRQAATQGLTGRAALQAISEATAYEHDFNFYSDVSGACAENVTAANPAEALLGDGGLAEELGGEVMRDNYDVFWMERIGASRGVTLAYGKNVTGMEIEIDTEDVVTRIIPVGYDESGDDILLAEGYVDSPLIGDYPAPCIRRIEYKDVKIGDTYADVEAVRAELRRRAQAEYDDGDLDKPVVTIRVQYLDMRNTDVGRNFAYYTNVYMGDTVRVVHEPYGIDILAEVTAYDWDAILEEYIEIVVSTRAVPLHEFAAMAT